MSSFGLTGGIASGKSTVAAMFGGLGARIIDADKLGHELLRLGTATFDEVVSQFGKDILDGQGEIDRGRLGEVIFARTERRLALNAIIHPAIMARRKELTKTYHAEDPEAVVISDAALIYEARIESWFLKIIVAWCGPEEQLERLISKTGLSREAAQQRIRSQMDSEEKRRLADFIIDTSGSREETKRQVEALYPQLKRLAETEPRAPKTVATSQKERCPAASATDGKVQQ